MGREIPRGFVSVTLTSNLLSLDISVLSSCSERKDILVILSIGTGDIVSILLFSHSTDTVFLHGTVSRDAEVFMFDSWMEIVAGELMFSITERNSMFSVFSFNCGSIVMLQGLLDDSSVSRMGSVITPVILASGLLSNESGADLFLRFFFLTFCLSLQ